jgi:aspartate kinase
MAKVSIVGAGMIGRPGVAAQMFSTLAAAKVNIEMISTSEVQVSCAIAESDCERAVAALCDAFDVGGRAAKSGRRVREANLPPVRGAALDLKQAQLAIRHVPDQPGMAAKVFSLLARHGISVDMIIQSQRCRLIDGVATRDIAFTVAAADVDEAQRILQAANLSFGEIIVDRSIAKVSIVGIGMVGRPGVAAQMFRALAEAKINIQMIATSEIKVSCLVAEDQGVQALQVIHAAFGLSGNERIVVPA